MMATHTHVQSTVRLGQHEFTSFLRGASPQTRPISRPGDLHEYWVCAGKVIILVVQNTALLIFILRKVGMALAHFVKILM